MLDKNEIWRSILKKFKTSSQPVKGACWILPDGDFMHVNTHGAVDEYVNDEYEEFDILEASDFGIMLEWYNCIRVNDGFSYFANDRYVQLPEKISNSQIYAIEEWLNELTGKSISIEFNNQMYDFDLDDINSIMGKIRRFYNSDRSLKESLDPDNQFISFNNINNNIKNFIVNNNIFNATFNSIENICAIKFYALDEPYLVPRKNMLIKYYKDNIEVCEYNNFYFIFMPKLDNSQYIFFGSSDDCNKYYNHVNGLI